MTRPAPYTPEDPPPLAAPLAAPRGVMKRGAGLAATLSDSAVFAGLYVTGAAAFCAQVSGLSGHMASPAILASLLLAFTTTVAVYLLDRVKLRDAWLDPADALSHARRHAFVIRHARSLRCLSIVLLVVASGVGAWLLPFGWLLPLASAIGVLAYAGRPRGDRARPKDILLLKNAYVAAGVTGFAAIIAIGAAHPDSTLASMHDVVETHNVPLLVASVLLAVRVLADAILCDLDDESADRRFNTRTLPVRLGRTNAWNAAMAMRLSTAGVLAIVPVLPIVPRIAWAVVTVVSSLTLRLAAPSRTRDWVDSRIAIEAAVVWLTLIALQ